MYTQDRLAHAHQDTDYHMHIKLLIMMGKHGNECEQKLIITVKVSCPRSITIYTYVKRESGHYLC